MQFIVKNFLRLLILSLPLGAFSQSTYLLQGSKHETFLQRLEVLLQTNPDLNAFTPKPLSRLKAVEAGLYADSLQKAGKLPLSRVDEYNLRSLFMNNAEWMHGDTSDFASKKSLWNTFYRNKAHMLEVNNKDFFLAVDPVLQEQQSIESNNSQRIFLNTRGLNVRGMIGRRLGFFTYISDNQERAPLFVQERINRTGAVPGEGFYKPFKNTATDYFDGRAYITFNALKALDFQFGYDKNFIGNGYRSLFLSDFANSYLFLKINTRIWKLNFENLFMELTSQFEKGGPDRLLDKKYAAMQHLSINATRWLNLGVFDGVVFARKNSFDLSYLNPLMFLRIAEQQNGSPDKAIAGIDFKANVAHRLQFYGQLMLNEFVLRELRGGNGWWGNKFGIQAGGKYVDAFGVKNLDLQGELNLVRPFTYTHNDSVSNYSHYNQPLAHPLGANFVEIVGIARYQPFPKWTASARIIAWKQGVDTGSANLGNDIFKLYTTRSADYGFKIAGGPSATAVNLQLLLSYEIKQNLFFEASALIRRWNDRYHGDRDTNLLTAGIRLNIARREYDY